MFILCPLITLYFSSVRTYSTYYPEQCILMPPPPRCTPQCRHYAPAWSLCSRTVLEHQSLQHLRKTSTHPPQPGKGTGCPGGLWQWERSPHSQWRLLCCPWVGCWVWASHGTSIVLRELISQGKRFIKSQPVWKNDPQIKQALSPAPVWCVCMLFSLIWPFNKSLWYI